MFNNSRGANSAASNYNSQVRSFEMGRGKKKTEMADDKPDLESLKRKRSDAQRIFTTRINALKLALAVYVKLSCQRN